MWCGRTVARSVHSHVITKFSRMGRLPHFVSYGAPRVELRYDLARSVIMPDG